MWQGFTIALREGIEMFLIIALILSYLKRTGRAGLARAVYAGTAVSLATCYVAFLFFQRAANRSLWEASWHWWHRPLRASSYISGSRRT